MPMAETATALPNLDQVVRRIQSISSLPHVALKVMEVANDPDAGAADLKEAMESDAALSARVLQCVNSSAYAVRQRVTNLQHAIAYLGLKQVRNLAVTAAVSELFKQKEAMGTYSREALWRHLVSVGLCSRLIALRLSFQNFEDIFLAGLLHDVGIILEDQHVHGPFAAAMGSLQEGKPLIETEREHLGFDHTVLGKTIAEKWGFPQSVIAAIRYHHASTSYRGDQIDAVRCVEMANLIATLKDISSVGKKLVTFSRPALEGLSLGRDDVQVLSEGLDQEISNHASLFSI
ncbi:MAG: HDOD domain-containing protein [Candidatus Nealsonbacteria bacterium]|nr:HDOD domain-containing protein [Candidatus Nealsonbacteria bacterium]